VQPQHKCEAQSRICPLGTRRSYWQSSLLLRPGRRHMRVKLCSRCSYTPLDLAGHYDPAGLLHVCTKCAGEQAVSTNYYPRKAHRRQQCVIAPNILGMAQPSVARFATEGLVLYGTTPGEPHFVQRSAPTASRHARKAIADGYGDFTPPDDRGEALAAIFGSSGFWSEEPAQ
jgi:hypothetical protein